MIERLTDDEIEFRLADLPRWRRCGDALECHVTFPTFAAAIGFIAAAGTLAEAANHHPDIDLRWRKVFVRLTTHDAGGITVRDFALAAALDALIPGAPEPVN